jgi:triacylglycerol lipase
VAFAGTDPLVPANWLTDFDLLPLPDDIHTGFENAMKSVWPELRSAVLARDDAHRPLFLTGHSLGAALAVVAAKFLKNEDLVDASAVYTFGMPRCGGRRFVADYGSQLAMTTYRLVHGDDIVPTVPPAELGFRHVGRLLSCRSGDSFDPTARPAQTPSDEPSFAAVVFDGVRDLLHAAAAVELPPATQPGRLGEVYRLLPPGGPHPVALSHGSRFQTIVGLVRFRDDDHGAGGEYAAGAH